MKISGIKLSHLRNNEHFQLFQFIIILVNSIGASILNVENRFAAIIELHKKEDEAIKKIVKSAHTVQINAADSERGDIFRGLVNAVLSAISHFNPALRNAAVRLKIVLDTYGNITVKSHVEEMSAVYNLVKELTVKHADDVELLGLSGWLTELARLNTFVQTLMEERADEGAARTSLELKEVRTELDDAYRAFAELVDALAIVARENGTGDVKVYDDFIARLNQRIDMLSMAVAQRRGHSKSKNDGSHTGSGTSTVSVSDAPSF